MRPKPQLIAVIAFVSTPAIVHADEGMWTFDNFPKAAVKARFTVDVTDDWLRHVMRSSARIAGGCSASFVSPDGLVMTNHHCARSCVQQLSSAEKDFIVRGFVPARREDEIRCPEMEVNQLTEISDVTAPMKDATRGLDGEAFQDARKAAQARIEKACQTDDRLRCEVVSLYHGGRYSLHKYRRFQDVRLAFAPEEAIAFFGGDPDNFNFPRYDLDVAFVRVYEDGKPAHIDDHFAWSSRSPAPGDVTFVSGNPGTTNRLQTVSQLEYQRDVSLPDALLGLAELRGVLTEFGRRGKEQRRISETQLFGVENAFKALRGRFGALVDGRIVTEKTTAEKALRARVQRSPALRKEIGPAWDVIAKAQRRLRDIRKPYAALEVGSGFRSDLFFLARTLVRGTEELALPNEKRLEEFRDSALPAVKQRLFSRAPIYDELQVLLLTHSLTKLREELGADHPIPRKVLGAESPEEMAARLVKGTKLKDVDVRRKLWDGGAAAVRAAARTDTMLALALAIDVDARAIRKTWETEVDAPVRKSTESIARARFQIEGEKAYPDATFSARLSYGSVEGYEDNGVRVAPFTNFAGAYARHTGRFPFDLPKSWMEAKPRLDLETPLNMVTTNDIIGGNSGSPVINPRAEIVGLIFDGNIQSLGGAYGFDPATNRAISVTSAAITLALRNIYQANRLADELAGGK